MALLTGLPRRLVEQQLLNQAQAEEILASCKKEKQSFVTLAVAKKLVKAKELAVLASEEFGLPLGQPDEILH